MADYIIREDAFMALTGDITDCTIEEFIARLRDKLSKLPSYAPDKNVATNDLISRQAVADYICHYDCGCAFDECKGEERCDFVDAIMTLPSAEVRQA